MIRLTFSLFLLLAVSASARAGLHYSGEAFAELPSRWGGFLVDQRTLRVAALDRAGGSSPLRTTYQAAAKKLEQAAKARPLTADEAADLGALNVRLGNPGEAVKVLRPAARMHPNHFRTAANLGTAWQLAGDLEQAAAALEEAVRLAPVPLKEFETYHLKLVQLRLKEGRAALKPEAPDDLFGVKYVGDSGKAEPGRIAKAEWKRLPDGAAAVVQSLALSLPADGRLLWQLGEIANAHSDVRTAAAILDGCVTEFAMSSADLRNRRRAYRAAADEQAKRPDHEQHRGTFLAKSARPLARQFDVSTLPAIRATGSNPLPWGLLATAAVDAKSSPVFPKRLEQLDGKTVVLTGFMQPVGDRQEFSGFLLLEYPVGCWFCETPEPTGLVSVELEPGRRTGLKRGHVKVTGVLVLNRDNPEDFLFRVKDARVGEPE